MARSDPTARQFGDGTIYRRNNRWYIGFCVDGRQVCESSRSTDRRKAERLLQQRLQEVAEDRYGGATMGSLRFEDLIEALRESYRLKRNRSTRRMEIAVAWLALTFAGQKVSRITTRAIAAYPAARMAAEASLSTVRYELAILRRAFNAAKRRDLVRFVPSFPELGQSEPRTGFVSPDELEALCQVLPPYLAPVARFAYLTGWRKEEMLRLTWDRVDFRGGWVRLDPSMTKNKKGREFPFAVLPQLEAVLQQQRQDTEDVAVVVGRPIPWVFHRNGTPIRDPYTAWRKAAKAIGKPGLLLHDFRRSAVRNLERAGVSQSVAMKLTGHQTTSVYQRYAISDEADLREAVAKLADAIYFKPTSVGA